MPPAFPSLTRAHWMAAGALALVLIAGGAVFYLTDPVRHAWLYPQCGLYRHFGIYCPGCGATRAFHALLHGDILRALQMNPLALALVPCLALACFRPRWVINYWFGAAVLVLLALYTVIRNIYPALAPG